MKKFSMLLIAIFHFSCQQKENKSVSVITQDSVNTKPAKIDNEIENKQIGDTIFMNSLNKNGLYTAEGSIDSLNSRVYVKFKNEKSGELKAQITPSTGKGNIRFNQIIFPDKTSDGPFGMDLKIQLKQKGDYLLVIGHSQMAENPFYGKFNVQLENKE
ncbi:hypothetical protein [Flavobacterium defluvii]|uniref:Uncharacterized protein n=1 Tax=Flavobacterium defluvii TaxID=370979 RepID=A0A1M5VN49_9FLAO|nr:hypothetical protein [Flavobacterium defluvii]SHH76686.1 hypothetical protein SAMN05443663_11170 [Flavobacterium defluvii]